MQNRLQVAASERARCLWTEFAAGNRVRVNAQRTSSAVAIPQNRPLLAISHWRNGIAAMFMA